MLTQVDVTNRRGNVLTLNMEENDTGYQVIDIQGLGPVNASLVGTSYAGVDGEQFQSSRRGTRNIIIKLELDPDFNPDTYTTLRQRLYTFFMTKSEVSLLFHMTSGLTVGIKAYVEEISAPQFEQDPEVEIGLISFEPDFADPQIVSIEGMSVDDNTFVPINYAGSVESGTVLTLNVNRILTDFTIYNMDESGTLVQLDFSGELQSGDQLVVSSLTGSKGITLTRDGISSSYLYGRSAQSGWIELFPGMNEFRVYANGDPIPYELEYVVRYGGL